MNATRWLSFALMLVVGPLFAGEPAPILKPGNPADHGLKESDLDSLRGILKKAVEDKALPGCSLLLAHKGEVIFKEAFGTFKVDTEARIASDTKPWTTTTVMVLVDRGKLDLDDPLAKWLPEFKGTKVENAKLRQIMSHTGGILPSILPGANPPGTLADAIANKVAKNGKLIEPGEFHYGGTSMDTIARVAEVAGQMPFEEQLRKHVWEPLGLKSTRFASAADPKTVTKEAAARGEGRYVACGGGLASTLDDLAAFYQMHLNGGAYGDQRLLSEKAVAAMLTHQKSATNSRPADGAWGPDYGLGFYLNRPDKNGKYQTIHHGGALGTMGWADLDRQVVGVFFSQVALNRARPVIVEVQKKVRDLIPMEPAKTPNPQPVPEFNLMDVKGNKHSLAEWKDSKAVVLLFIATECPVSNGYSPEYIRLAKAFGERGVLVWGVYPDPDVTAEIATKHAKEYGLTFPLILDPTQVLAKATKVRVTPEAVVLSAEGRVLYRGRIDDRYSEEGKRRDEPRVRDLNDAIEAVLAGKPPPTAETKAFGCPLPRPRDDDSKKK